MIGRRKRETTVYLSEEESIRQELRENSEAQHKAFKAKQRAQRRIKELQADRQYLIRKLQRLRP